MVTERVVGGYRGMGWDKINTHTHTEKCGYNKFRLFPKGSVGNALKTSAELNRPNALHLSNLTECTGALGMVAWAVHEVPSPLSAALCSPTPKQSSRPRPQGAQGAL